MKNNADKFLVKARKIHGDSYSYVYVEYRGSTKKVRILCNLCGTVFLKSPSNHLKGQGCPECSKKAKIKKLTSTTEEFVKKAQAIHEDAYDYTKVDYRRNNVKVQLTCNKCGSILFITPCNHLNGKGCSLCAIEKRALKRRLTKDEFIVKAKRLHKEKYNYSKVRYLLSSTPVVIICPIHGEYLQTPSDHMYGGCGCPKCGEQRRIKSKTRTTEQFIREAKTIHGDTYDYTETIYTGYADVVAIICSKHGMFYQEPRHHLNAGCGCPVCNQSKGENKIIGFLQKYNIKYEAQKRYKKCKHKRTLPFDFYLPDFNILIEYQGQGHYEPVDWAGKGVKWATENLKRVQIRDQIKKQFCQENGISLLEIAYWDFDNIEQILNKSIRRE